MKKDNLQQQRYWNNLQQMLAKGLPLYKALRGLALIVVRESSEQGVVIDGKTVVHYGKDKEVQSKQGLLEHISKYPDTIDTTARILSAALGYQLEVTFKSPHQQFASSEDFSYIAYTPADDESTKTIRLEHTGGYHWQPRGGSAIGDGYCLYHSFAQQVAADVEVKMVTVAEDDSRRTALRQQQTQYEASSEIVVAEVEQAFNKNEKADQARYQKVRDSLQGDSVEKLIQLYRVVALSYISYTEGDTYLKNRPAEFTKETGSNIVVCAVTGEPYNREFDFIVKEQLIHMLAKEAWRSPQSMDKVMEQLNKSLTQTSNQLFRSCAQEAAVVTDQNPVMPATPAS